LFPEPNNAGQNAEKITLKLTEIFGVIPAGVNGTEIKVGLEGVRRAARAAITLMQ
jgi:hypothetical protein